MIGKKKLALVLIIAGVILLITACGGHPSSAKPSDKVTLAPVAGRQIPLKNVVAQVGCTKFVNDGPAATGLVIDYGYCFIGKQKYAADMFVSQQDRDAWIKAVAGLGVVPKWETATTVIYKSVD